MGSEGERADESPMIVMIDEGTGNKYARIVDQKGVGDGNEMTWLINDMVKELKSWGHPGAAGNALIL